MRRDTEVPASVPPTQHAHKYSIIPLHQCTTFPYVPRQIYIRLFVRIHATYIHLYVCMYIHITIYKNTYLNKQIHFSKDHLSLKEGCDQERKQRPPTSRHSPKRPFWWSQACYSTSAQQRGLCGKATFPQSQPRNWRHFKTLPKGLALEGGMPGLSCPALPSLGRGQVLGKVGRSRTSQCPAQEVPKGSQDLHVPGIGSSLGPVTRAGQSLPPQRQHHNPHPHHPPNPTPAWGILSFSHAGD